jgi:hypothetical protein
MPCFCLWHLKEYRMCLIKRKTNESIFFQKSLITNSIHDFLKFVASCHNNSKREMCVNRFVDLSAVLYRRSLSHSSETISCRCFSTLQPMRDWKKNNHIHLSFFFVFFLKRLFLRSLERYYERTNKHAQSDQNILRKSVSYIYWCIAQ